MMKKAISLMLALVLVVSLCGSALAATVSPSVSKTTVAVGESVDVTLTLSEKLENIYGMYYYLSFDEDLFELTGSKAGDVNPAMYLSQLLHEKEEYGSYYMISAARTGPGFDSTFNAGTMYTLTFTAKKDITESTDTAFTLYRGNMMNSSFQKIDEGQLKDPVVKITVTPAATGYTVALSPAEQSKTVGENAYVDVTIDGGSHTEYAAADLRFTYDASNLTFLKDESTIPALATVKDENGNLTIQIVGDTKKTTDAFKLAFRVTGSGDSTVKLTSAKLDESKNASIQDAPAATLGNDTATIHASNYTVTFKQEGWFTGESVVAPGADYTFTATDANAKYYTYSFADSTMGGKAVTVVDNGDGTFTIKNVTGNLVIDATKTAKKFRVTVTGSAQSNVSMSDDATYGEDYEFTLQNLKTDVYDYIVTVTVDGKVVDVELEELDLGGDILRLYTLAGSNITGPVVINAEKIEKAPKTTAITFTGSGSADVKGGTNQTADNGKDFTFELDAKTGYTYTVKLGDEILTAVDGKYTIPAAKLTGDALTVTVEKKLDVSVDVTTYVKLDGKVIYLVTAQGTLADGQVYTYDGEAMFYSEKYQASAYLVISDLPLNEFKEQAAAKIGTKEAAAVEIAYDCDVNGTTLVDVNDAQLVYNMYNAVYGDFETVTMLTFLRADVNGSKDLNVEDVSAIINAIQ